MATSESHPGREVMGKSEPAKKKGMMAIAGMTLMYSSALVSRVARISARP